jgi:hypothetical protein
MVSQKRGVQQVVQAMTGEGEAGEQSDGEIEKAGRGARLSIPWPILLILGGMSNWRHLSNGGDQALRGRLLGGWIRFKDICYP